MHHHQRTKTSAREVVQERIKKVTKKEAEVVETRSVALAEEIVGRTDHEAGEEAGLADVLEKEVATRMLVIAAGMIVDLRGDHPLTPRRIVGVHALAEEALLEGDLRQSPLLQLGQDLLPRRLKLAQQ